MTPSRIRLSVRWPDDRAVTVDVHVEAELGPSRSVERVVPIDSDQLASKTVLRSFLGDITRHEPDDGEVEAVVFESDVERLLSLLDVKVGPPPDPVIVELGDDG